jgi:hypothetical protein
VSLILPNVSAVHLSRSKNKKTNKISGGYQYLLNQNSNRASNFYSTVIMIIFGLNFVKVVLVLKMIYIYVTYIIPQKILLMLSH